MAEESQPVTSAALRPDARTRLLLVEDESDYAFVLQEALAADGGEQFLVCQVQHLAEALLRIESGSVDVIVLDLSLPDSEGIATLTRLHTAAPHLPLVVLTGKDDGALAAQAIQEGAQDYLVKGRIDGNLLKYSLHRAIDRKHRELVLHADEERLRQMVMGDSDYAIFLLDPAGRVSTWSIGAERVMGFQAEQIVGGHFSCLYPNEDQLQGKPEWGLKVATAQGRFQDEGWRVCKDGSRFWAEVVITVLRDQTGKLYGYSNLVRDITERKRAVDALEQRVYNRTEELAEANEALQDSVARLEQLDKMKDRFLAIVTHELRAPIQSIIGYTELLQGGIMPPDQVEDALATIHQSALNQVSLINNLLDLAKLDAGQLKVRPVPTDLARVVNDSLRMFRYHTDQKQLRIKVVLPPDLPKVQADPERLRQIITNLVGNAIKFTPAGEEICLRVALLESGLVEVQVADSGIGIEPADFPLIFKQFGQVESAQTQGIKGTGLGLPITKSLVELMGGRIWVESTPGKGSTFFFTLPPAAAQP